MICGAVGRIEIKNNDLIILSGVGAAVPQVTLRPNHKRVHEMSSFFRRVHPSNDDFNRSSNGISLSAGRLILGSIWKVCSTVFRLN